MIAVHGVSLEVKTARVEQGQRVWVRIDDRSGRSVGYGEPWSIQRKVPGGWVTASFSLREWFEPAYFLSPHSVGEWEGAPVPVDARPGVYRAVKEVEIGRTTKVRTAEFRVVPNQPE
jgi:hypothetical protein